VAKVAAGVLLVDLQREKQRLLLTFPWSFFALKIKTLSLVVADRGDTLETLVGRRDNERQPFALGKPTHLLGRKRWLSGPPVDSRRVDPSAARLTLALGARQLGGSVRIDGRLDLHGWPSGRCRASGTRLRGGQFLAHPGVLIPRSSRAAAALAAVRKRRRG
jgi:hypothetical protein